MGINNFSFILVLSILNYVSGDGSTVSELVNQKYQEHINDDSSSFTTNCYNCNYITETTNTPLDFFSTLLTHQEINEKFESSDEATNTISICGSCKNENPKISNFSLSLQNKTAVIQWSPLNEIKEECKFKYNINSTSTSIISYFRRIDINKHTLDNLKPCKNYSISIEPSNICSRGEIYTTNFFTDPIEIEDISITFSNNQTEIRWEARETDDCYKYKIDIDGMFYETINKKSFIDSSELICKKIGIQSIREDGKYGIKKYQQKPGKVRNLNVKLIDGMRYMVEWDANENSECVTSYLINVNGTKMQSNTTQKLVNISNYCTAYNIKVAALSNFEVGEFVTIIIPPREPENLNEIENPSFTFYKVTNNLVLTWDKKVSSYDKTCKYSYLVNNKYSYSLNNINNETKFTTYTFLDVKPCTNFSVEVYTKLNEKMSKGKLVQFKIPGKDPDLPVLKYTNVTNNSAILHFEMFDYESYSCNLKNLSIFCKINNVDKKNLNWTVQESNSSYHFFDLSASIFDVEVTNLSAFTNYSCHLVLYTNSNLLEMKSDIKLQTLEAAPSKPENLVTLSKKATTFKVSWSKPLKVPGIINSYEIEIKPLHSLHFIPLECNLSNSAESMVDLLDSNTYNFEYFNAYPHYFYEIRLKAKIKNNYGPESQLFVSTENSAPEAPTTSEVFVNNSLGDSYNVTATVFWKYPCKPNGEIEDFVLTIKEISNLTTNSKRIERIKTNNLDKQTNYSYEITNIKPLKDYEIRLNAVLKDGTTGKDAVIKFSSPDGLPGIPRLVSIDNITPTNFIIKWEEPENKNGLIINYEIKIKTIKPLHSIPDNCDKPEQEFLMVTSNNSTVFNFTEGLPNYLYAVEIRAETKSGFGKSLQSMHKSLRGDPEQVRNVNYKTSIKNASYYDANVTISFEHPCNLNGEFEKYEVTLAGSRKTYGGFVHNVVLNNLTYQVHLEPDVTYSLKITTFTNEGNSTSKEFSFTSPSGVPLLLNNVTCRINKMTPSTVDIVINQNMFQDDFGSILYYAVILSQAEFFNSYKGDYGFWDGVNWPKIGAWNQVNDSVLPYQATPIKWNPFNDNDNYFQNTSIIYKVGDENCTKTSTYYCNGPLRNKTLYALVVRAFTKNAFRDAPAVYFETPSINDNNISIILGSSLGVLAVVLTITVILCCRHRKPKEFQEFTEDVVIEKHDYSVLKFPQYYSELRKNPDFIKNEYKTLGAKSAEYVLPKNIAVLPHNRKKNRYTNILPYDDNSVLLNNYDESSNYINASYIKGYSDEVEYIATQGPLESTLSDFWKMVIDEKVTVIVMVAQFVEQRKEKCFKYFPDIENEMETEDGWLISCVSELLFDYYCERHIILQKDNETHKIIHLQYLNWPDFDCPEGTENMINFCKLMKEHNVNREKIVVHCSAGVGRTGTIIAIDILLQAIKHDEDIDVFNTVLDLRKQRQNMVQTEAQYLYINTCLFDAITKPQELLEIKVTEPTFKKVDILEMDVLNKSDTNDNIKVINEETDIS